MPVKATEVCQRFPTWNLTSSSTSCTNRKLTTNAIEHEVSRRLGGCAISAGRRYAVFSQHGCSGYHMRANAPLVNMHNKKTTRTPTEKTAPAENAGRKYFVQQLHSLGTSCFRIILFAGLGSQSLLSCMAALHTTYRVFKVSNTTPVALS